MHLPWCLRKCPYCDFNSHPIVSSTASPGQKPALSSALEQAYTRALIRDWQSQYARFPQLAKRSLISIFFGGGTPSLFSAHSIDQILSAINHDCPFSSATEITLECNPASLQESLAQKQLQDFRHAGINRLSIGVQSFDDRLLATLGRMHSGQTARQTIAMALSIFPKVNADLMFALPDQNLSTAIHDVQEALNVGLNHLSCYQLTIEPNTVFYAKPPVLPDEDRAAEMSTQIAQMLIDQGLDHYEVSAFARPQHACAHNLHYWRFGDYVGIGAGAHGKISQNLPSSLEIVRTERIRHPQSYITQMNNDPSVLQIHQVSQADRPLEFMMNALRLTEGFNIALWQAQTKMPLPKETINTLIARGLLQKLSADGEERIAATTMGLRHLNYLLTFF